MSGGLQAPLRSATGSSPCLGEEFVRGCGRFSMVKKPRFSMAKNMAKNMVWYGLIWQKKPWLSYNQHGLIWFDMAKKMWFNYPSKMVWRWLNIGLWPLGEMVNIKWRIPSFFPKKSGLGFEEIYQSVSENCDLWSVHSTGWERKGSWGTKKIHSQIHNMM